MTRHIVASIRRLTVRSYKNVLPSCIFWCNPREFQIDLLVAPTPLFASIWYTAVLRRVRIVVFYNKEERHFSLFRIVCPVLLHSFTDLISSFTFVSSFSIVSILISETHVLWIVSDAVETMYPHVVCCLSDEVFKFLWHVGVLFFKNFKKFLKKKTQCLLFCECYVEVYVV